MEELRKQWIHFRNKKSINLITQELWGYFYKEICKGADREVHPDEFNTAMNFLLKSRPDKFIERWDVDFEVQVLTDTKGREILCS